MVMYVVGRGRRERFTQDVFRSLTEGEEALLDRLSDRSIALASNRDLLREGEVGAQLFRILRGWAYRFRSREGGCRQILDFLLPGEIVGLQASLLGIVEHSVRSLTALRVAAIDGRIVTEVFRAEPALAMRLAQHVAAEASRTDELLTVIGCCSALERMAFLMISLYRRQARRGAIDPLDCPFPLRRQHIADALGLTGAHVNRTLNRLRLEGVAWLEDQHLSIGDLARLAVLAGESTTDRAGP